MVTPPVKHRTVRLGSQRTKHKAECSPQLVAKAIRIQAAAIHALRLMGRELPEEIT